MQPGVVTAQGDGPQPGAFASCRCAGFWAEFRKPNPRNPKEGRKPKAETHMQAASRKVQKAPSYGNAHSALGFRVSFGFRRSNFGFCLISRYTPPPHFATMLVLAYELGHFRR